MRILSVLACVTVACVSPDAPDLAAEEQTLWDGSETDPNGETIVIEGVFDDCWDGHCFPSSDPSEPVEPPSGPGGGWGGGGGPGHDPEPDRNNDRKSCFDWCSWSRRQCEKWCWKEYPDFFGDWYKRNRCFKERCDDSPDPDIGLKACEADCQRKFPERPIVTSEGLYDE